MAITSQAVSTEVDVQLTLIDSTLTETISYSTGDTARATVRHSGYMEANLTFDPISQRPTAIYFIGGIIIEPASSFKNTADIRFNGLGTKHVVLEQSSSELNLRFLTIGSSHPINDDGWILETDRIRTYPFVGTLTRKITIDGRTQMQTIDVATNPPDTFEPSTGSTIRLQVFETRNNGATSNYKITFHGTVNESYSQDLPNTDTTITGSSSGTTYAEGTFIAPNKYGQWLLDQGYSMTEHRSTESRGIPLALLYALNLTPDRSQRLPWSFTRENSELILSLQLPADGLQMPIQIQASVDPRLDEWTPLAADDFLDGNATLDLGATGTRRIRFPDTESRFYRIVPEGLSN